MKARAWLAAAALALSALSASVSVRADTPPDVWSRARDPGERARWALHLEVRRILAGPRLSPFPSLIEVELRRARDLLEQAHAAESNDVVLLFDLGLVYEALELHEKAIAVLEPALALAKGADHPAAPEAWMKLALAYAKLDRPADERRSYIEFLARATEPDERGVALYNFAETEMRLGHLAESIRAYREALDYSKQFVRSGNTYVLALWGLAVALDRYGDLSASDRESERAVQSDPYDHIIDDHDSVFFVPSYERAWYLGIGASARARTTPDLRLALRFAQKAEAHFQEYVTRATPKDRWKALAEKKLAAAKRERMRLEAKVRALPRIPRRTEEEEVN